jgi:hypothetical protein
MSKTFTTNIESTVYTFDDEVGPVQFLIQGPDDHESMMVDCDSYIHGDVVDGDSIKTLTISDTETPGSMRGKPRKANEIGGRWYVTYVFQVDGADFALTYVGVQVPVDGTPDLNEGMYLSWRTA